jgi:hypothetical protein
MTTPRGSIATCERALRTLYRAITDFAAVRHGERQASCLPKLSRTCSFEQFPFIHREIIRLNMVEKQVAKGIAFVLFVVSFDGVLVEPRTE